jgi:prepilin peptidase CpaA
VSILTLLIPLVLLIAATVCDLRKREIPDALPLTLFLWSLFAVAAGWSQVTWLNWGGGVAAGFVIGAVFFALGALGGGDVKLLGGVGGVVGVSGLASMLFWMALAGGVLGVIAKCRGQKELAYGPALLAGFLIHSVYSGGFSDVLS